MRHFTVARWAAVCLLLCAAIAIVYLPPLVVDGRVYQPFTSDAGPSELALHEANREATEANDRLKRLLWLDELESMTPVTTAAGSSVVVSLPEDVPAETKLAVESAMSDAVDLMAPAGAQVRVGLLLTDANRDGHPELAGRGITNGTEFYVGEGASGPYCYEVRIRSSSDRSLSWLDGRLSTAKSAAQTLGPCVFYAAFGLPGAHIESWMTEGGHRLAGPIFVDSYPALGRVPLRRVFGLFNEQGAGLPLHACAGGDGDMCERLFLVPASRDPWAGPAPSWNPKVPVASFTARGPSPWVPIMLLGWARQEFGDHAFQEFWQSDLVVAEAFNAAFPTRLEDWMQGWVRTRTGTISPGPTMSAADLGGSLAFVLLCAALTLQFTRRRALPARMRGSPR